MAERIGNLLLEHGGMARMQHLDTEAFSASPSVRRRAVRVGRPEWARGGEVSRVEVGPPAGAVNGGGMLDQWGGVKLYHLVSMAGINVRANCSGKCPAGGLGSRRRAGRSW